MPLLRRSKLPPSAFTQEKAFVHSLAPIVDVAGPRFWAIGAARLKFDEPQDDVAAVDLPEGIRRLSKLGGCG